MAWSLYNHMVADQVKALLDALDEDNKDRADFEPGIPREMAESAIHALLWAYGSRPSDTACGYAMLNLWNALRVDWTSLKFLPASAIEAASAGETTKIGSTEGESAVAKPDAQRIAP